MYNIKINIPKGTPNVQEIANMISSLIEKHIKATPHVQINDRTNKKGR
jgi:hypothetical protein